MQERADLPIDEHLSRLNSLLLKSQTLFVTASPGAGKTTRLPWSLTKSFSGKVLVLSPRRLAALAAAQRVAEENGHKIGSAVGYQVRFASKVTDGTRLIYMTDAILLRKLVRDPLLSDVDVVVLDEFHERTLNQDLLLGAIRELQQLNNRLRLVVMSATMNLAELKTYAPEADSYHVPGLVFPLEVRHSSQPLSTRTDHDFVERVGRTVIQVEEERRAGVLVFLPGVGEIHRVADWLENRNPKRSIQKLYGTMNLDQQHQVLQPSERARIVLATNIAEASVTVPGVDTVLDTGLARVNSFNFNSGFGRLELTRTSRFSSEQRSGRAAREKAGLAVRLWTSHEEVTQPEQLPAEVHRLELTASLLWLARMGVGDPNTFLWFERPPARALAQALEVLRQLGAVDQRGQLSTLGERLFHFPLEPRLSALLVNGESLGCADLAAILCAFLDSGLKRGGAILGRQGLECDVQAGLEAMHDHSPEISKAAFELLRQLGRMVGGNGSSGTVDQQAMTALIDRLVFLAFSDRLCRRRGRSGRGVMVGGRGVALSPSSNVKTSDFFFAIAGIDQSGGGHDQGAETTISLARGISKERLLAILDGQIDEEEILIWNEEKEQVEGHRVRRYRDLVLQELAKSKPTSDNAGAILCDALLNSWDNWTQRHSDLRAWLARWQFFARYSAEAAAAFSIERRREFIELAAFGCVSLAEVLERPLVSVITSLVSRDLVQDFEKELPSVFLAPSGQTHAIQYDFEHGAAFVDVRLQEIFGLLATPTLAGGKVPLTFRLLGPNFRPMQVTQDLAGFWRTGYFEVRKELRSRYPKHAWPEDPLTARPEAKGRRRQ